MKTKVYLNFDEQIEKLKKDGLIIDDEKLAKKRLKWEGYFNFAVGYNRLFKDNNKKYIEGTRFEYIESLYDFDKHLRGIVYEYIQGIENNIKALISDIFSKHYGVNEREYLSEENFTTEKEQRGNVRWLISTCRGILADSIKYGEKTYRDYIAHNAKNYGHVPLWALIRALSFGNASKFFKLMKESDKKIISKEYHLDSNILCNMTEMLVCFRNIVAHGERLYCARLPSVRLTDKLSVYRKLQIPKFPDGRYKFGRCDFMSLMIIFKYMLPVKEFSSFMIRVIKEVDELKSSLPKFAMSRVYEATGLSGSWRKLASINIDKNC